MRRINRKTERRSKLLDRLQEESWQLELIVSGVVIFLLIGLHPYLGDFASYLSVMMLGSSAFISVFTALWGFVGIAYFALIGMFLFHLALRGMWIGAIGLRSVSGGFDHDYLDFPGRYGKFLRSRLGSFDDYIERLERNASVTFSLAFLLFFAIFSIGLFFSAITLGVLVLTFGKGGYEMGAGLAGGSVWIGIAAGLILTWVLLMTFAGLTYFIDFITFGWVKRRRLFGKLYYPFYRFLGWVTLARLYRPFYYNIIDNPFGKKLVRVYALITLAVTILLGVEITPFANFSYSDNAYGIVSANYYLDNGEGRKHEEGNSRSPSLAGRYAENSYHELFVPLQEQRISSVLRRRFPELRPLTPSGLGFFNRRRLADQKQTRIDSTLNALSSLLRVSINDSLVTDVPWRFYEHPVREQPGLLYDIPVYALPHGEYWVKIESQQVGGDSLYWENLALISFLK